MYGAGVVFGLLFYGFAIFWIILATIIVAVDQRKADFDCPSHVHYLSLS